MKTICILKARKAAFKRIILGSPGLPKRIAGPRKRNIALDSTQHWAKNLAKLENKPARKTRGDGAQRVYRKLREDILSLELAPGELLDEVTIGQKFSLSRSPVREALIRLASDGLVRTLPNKSTMVAPLNIEAFPQYLDALDLVQRVTTRLAALLRSPSDLEKIDDAQAAFAKAAKDRDALRMIETNRNLHIAISEAGQNPYFTDTYTRLLDEGRRMLRLYFRSFDDHLPPDLAKEHSNILEAIRQRDADLAERLAHEHALQVGDRFLEYLGRRHTDGFSLVQS